MDANSPNDNSTDAYALRQRLVDELKSKGTVQSPLVEEAFRAVPRHLFVTDMPLESVYSDESIYTKRVKGQPASAASAPSMMAIMLEQLDLHPGQGVLEIGAGTGYNAALIAHIVGPTGQVVTVEIDEDLVAGARIHLSAAGFDDVQVVCADGGFGYPDMATYDRVILTVGAWDIAPPWQDQLIAGGRLVLPLSIAGPYQKSVAFEKTADHLTSVSIAETGFVWLRGALVEPDTHVRLGPELGFDIQIGDGRTIDTDMIYSWLMGPSREVSTKVRVAPREIRSGACLWLALHEPTYCELNVEGESPDRGRLPYLWRWSNQRGTVGVSGDNGLCVMMRRPDESPPVELLIRSYGRGDALAERLIEQMAAWDLAGRPSTNGLRIRAYPRDTKYVTSNGEFVVGKRWTQLVLDWQLNATPAVVRKGTADD